MVEAVFSQSCFPTLNALPPLLKEPKAGRDSLKLGEIGKCVKINSRIPYLFFFYEFQSLY